MKRSGFVVVAWAGIASLASAELLPIVSYSMENGQSGTQTYFDDTYGGPGATGNPAASGSFLSGGLGQLTDGTLAPLDIFADEWIGWVSIQPTITFNLGSTFEVNTLSIHTSNESAPFNDVGAFGTAVVSFSADGVSFTTPVNYLTTDADRTGDDPRWIDIPLGGVTAQFVRVQLLDGFKNPPLGGDGGGNKPWIFISEAQVDGVIPEPTTALLVLAGAAALGRGRRRG